MYCYLSRVQVFSSSRKSIGNFVEVAGGYELFDQNNSFIGFRDCYGNYYNCDGIAFEITNIPFSNYTLAVMTRALEFILKLGINLDSCYDDFNDKNYYYRYVSDD